MKFLLGIALSFLLSSTTLGHGGGLDSSGCHRQTSNNSYHCHRNTTPLSDGSNNSSSEGSEGVDVVLALGLLAAGILVWKLSNKDGKHSALSFKPMFNVTSDNQGGLSLSEYGLQLKFHF